MPRRIVSCLCLALAAATTAETAGPPVPLPAKHSPAEQATALYRAEHPVAGQAKDCAPARRGEIVVCGSDRSPYRLPLPAERGAPDQRIATGELPHIGIGGSPVAQGKGTGLTLTMRRGQRAEVSGND